MPHKYCLQNLKKSLKNVFLQVFTFKGIKNGQDEFRVNTQKIYPQLSSAVRAQVEAVIPQEIEFYEFAVKRFELQKRHLEERGYIFTAEVES